MLKVTGWWIKMFSWWFDNWSAREQAQKAKIYMEEAKLFKPIDVKSEFLKANLDAILLKQSNNDRACNWRTWRICYNGNYVDIHLTEFDLFLNSFFFQEGFVLPVKAQLQGKFKMLFENKEGVKYRVLDKRISDMTREEAIKLAKKFGHEKPWYEDTVSLLEALGLIKFEELNNYADTGNSYVDIHMYIKHREAIVDLERNGYKIVKC